MKHETKSYVLKSKDVPILYFDLNKRTSEIDRTEYVSYFLEVKGIEEQNCHLLPKGLLLTEDNEENSDNVLKWLKARTAPKHRQYIDKVLDFLEISKKNPIGFVDITYGLSLNDAFWATDINDSVRWEDVNLYHTPLDKVIARIAFTGVPSEINNQKQRSTPELVSGGALRKCWINKSDGIYLWKAEEPLFVKSDGRSSVSMEHYAAQIAEAMGLPYVPYSLLKHKRKDGKTETICECPLFTSENVGFVDADSFFRDRGIKISYQDMFSADTHVQLAEVFGYEAYADMMLFDSIILNSDRHLGNFGMLVDNNTGEYIGPAPLFDNGMSALVGIPTAELEEDITKVLESESCTHARYLDFNEQAELFVSQRHLRVLEALTKFKLKSSSVGVAPSSVEFLNFMIHYRSQKAIDFFKEKELRNSWGGNEH